MVNIPIPNRHKFIKMTHQFGDFTSPINHTWILICQMINGEEQKQLVGIPVLVMTWKRSFHHIADHCSKIEQTYFHNLSINLRSLPPSLSLLGKSFWGIQENCEITWLEVDSKILLWVKETQRTAIKYTCARINIKITVSHSDLRLEVILSQHPMDWARTNTHTHTRGNTLWNIIDCLRPTYTTSRVKTYYPLSRTLLIGELISHLIEKYYGISWFKNYANRKKF